MRNAHLVTPWLLGLSLTTPWALAQTPPSPPPAAPTTERASSTAAQRPLVHTALPASGPLVASPQDWRAANAAVATFARGHADVLRWEAAQTPATAPTAPGTHQHGGQP